MKFIHQLTCDADSVGQMKIDSMDKHNDAVENSASKMKVGLFDMILYETYGGICFVVMSHNAMPVR